MKSVNAFTFQIYLAIIVGNQALSEGHLNDVLRSYDTIHSSHLSTHHVTKRSLQSGVAYQTEKVVSFSSFGREFRLRLFPQEGLFTSDLFIGEVGKRQTTEISLDLNEFYTGFLDGESRIFKTHAYWEEKNLVAAIQTRNDTYYIEPSWRHLPESDSYTMIVYKLSDVRSASQSDDHRVAFCNPPQIKTNLSSEKVFTHSATSYANSLTGRERLKRQSGNEGDRKSNCPVMLVADYKFSSVIGQSSASKTAKYMIGVLSRVNNIYMNTDFGQDFSNLGFLIKGILVHTSPTIVENTGGDGLHYNMEKSDAWDTSQLLNVFSMNSSWIDYCLVHLFTSQSFDNGVLGLAWVASDKPNSLGGICSLCASGKCFNTGWSTAQNKFKKKLVTLEADLVTAHELGHGWGAQHDPDIAECSPSAAQNGKFIMYPFSVSGLDPNNKHFSPCSRRTISSVLQVKKDSCFSVPSNEFCGNFKKDEGEQCDAGPGGGECCTNTCQLLLQCSDETDDCCQDCRFASNTTVCGNNAGDDKLTSCRAVSRCPGDRASCPAKYLPDGSACLNNGHCVNGICRDVCEYNNMISCICDDVKNSCLQCCKETSNDTCSPYMNKTLADGYSCKQGYCQSGVCQRSISTTTNRQWDVIEHFDADHLLLFMRRNLVLATIILTLIPYLIFCIVICVLDHKKKQKAMQRQAWLHKDNDRLTLDKTASHIRKIEGIHHRPTLRPGQ